jgi:hypothetical protein
MNKPACVHCRFFVVDHSHSGQNKIKYARCNNKSASPDYDKMDLVSGVYDCTLKSMSFCSVNRKFDHLCGEKGKYFEPTDSRWQLPALKPKWWQFWK